MRLLICIAALTLVALATGAPLKSCDSDKPYYDLDEAPELFEKFIEDHNRHYKDEDDKQEHYEAFVKSLETINRLNSEEQGSAKYDINNFADYTDAERKKMFGYRGA